jgi:hypothetical protein
MLIEPPLELLPFPALGEMVAEERKGSFQLSPSKEPGEVMPALVAIWPVHAPPEPFRELAERKRIARVEFYLEIGLLSVSREGSFSHDEAHNVSDIKFAHEAEYNRDVPERNSGTWHANHTLIESGFVIEQWHVAITWHVAHRAKEKSPSS